MKRFDLRSRVLVLGVMVAAGTLSLQKVQTGLGRQPGDASETTGH